jgi:regulator of replication initiation timing
MTEQQNENASAPATPSFGQICWQIFEKFSKMEQEMADLKKNGNKLEKENEQLKTEMAKLLAENRELREVKAQNGFGNFGSQKVFLII